MSTPTTTSQPPAPPAAPLEASQRQVTGPHWSRRWRRWRPGVIAVALMLIPVLVTVWARTITSTTPLAIDNPKDWGTMALAELLRHEGSSVSKAGSLSEAVDAGRQGATIAVVNADRLSDQDRRALAARRLRERRSSSLMPPQTPASWPFSSAHFRQVSTTSQRPHTSFALAIWAMAGPVFPTGKKSSGSTVRHAAWLRQSIRAPYKVIGHAVGADPTCQGTAAASENNFHTTGGGGQDLDHETCADTLS